MQKKTMTPLIGAFGAAALIGIGMVTSVPHMNAQDSPQQTPAGRMGRGPGGPGFGRGRGGPGGPMGLGIDPRDLTDAQREQVKAIRQAHAAEMTPAMDRLDKAHQALANAVISGSGDVRGLAQEVGAAEGEMAFQQAQIETEMLNVLTPEQKQKMQERRKAMEARRAEMQQRRQGGAGGSGNQK